MASGGSKSGDKNIFQVQERSFQTSLVQAGYGRPGIGNSYEMVHEINTLGTQRPNPKATSRQMH